ncbi:hypothetical protein Tco_1112602 [Tanacetum coccineum]|uniref:Uncharacterized protein n=1 Tax=Tanacetum coccineum TaxID=301880 RepID=A0ABQ5ITH7_9ASTR
MLGLAWSLTLLSHESLDSRVQACLRGSRTRRSEAAPSLTLLTNLPHSVPQEAPLQLAPLLDLLDIGSTVGQNGLDR